MRQSKSRNLRGTWQDAAGPAAGARAPGLRCPLWAGCRSVFPFSRWEVIMSRSRSSDIESLGSIKGSHRVGSTCWAGTSEQVR